ncbi:MAG: hypothetical protein KDE27_26735 [Planctomycetes bacterium]|nr:hypothetical protein [Planctomycetota bacterium]
MSVALRPLLRSCLVVVLAVRVAAQDLPTRLDEPTVQAMNELAQQLDQARTDRQAAAAAGDAQRGKDLDLTIQELEWQFGSLASRTNVREFEEAPPAAPFDLQKEILSLVEPVVEAAKGLTAESRQIAGLKGRIEQLELRQRQAELAQRITTRTRDLLPPDAPARAEAERDIAEWGRLIERARSERNILEARHRALTESQTPFLEHVRTFFRQRGLNLLLAGVAFAAVLLGSRWLQARLLSRRRRERAVSLRVLEVLFSALGVLLAIVAALVVPWLRDDYLLLAIGVIFLIGAGWVLVKAAPQFYEQIRLILNIGSVREGERILVEGLPYRVDNLRFYSTLVNPELQGGELRVPIQHLIGQRSRVPGADEPWFPTRVDDHVMLEDGVIGRVLTQTPEFVVVDDFAAPKTYATTEFLAQKPRNLSRGFGMTSAFGVDYAHQRDATTRIPAALQTALQSGLEELVPAEQICRVEVQFASAGSSSLDLNARVDFDGAAAPRFRELSRALQRLLVDACTENGWNIPFPQLTVHRSA